MVLNSLGNPVISHRNGPTSEIMVVTCTNPTCTSITETAIDNSPGALATTSIALDCNDNPVVSYYQQTPADLKLGVDSPGCAAGFSSTPAAGSTLLLESAYTTPAQDTISVSSVGDPNFPLGVTLESITPGYQVLSGLPISGLLSTDPAATITVQCDSSPHPDGALVLNTSDPAQPTVTFNLECDAILPELTGAPAAPGPLAFSALTAAPAQLSLNISNTGNPGTLLDVSLASIDSGYSIISGLPIDDLGTSASPIAITVQCDSAPQAAGTLVLNTNNPLEPTVSYDLTCTALEAQFSASPTPPGPLDFVDLPASSPQLSIDITNTGMAGSLLNVDVSSPLSAGYTVLSGLPIASLPAGNSATVIIECSSVPQLDGVLELSTNDPLQPTVSYDLTCTALEAQFSGSPAAPGPLVFVDGALQLDIEVSNSGVTNSQLDVSLASITPGYTVVSGLPISGLLAGAPPESISVQCDSLPQAAGTLVLNTNDHGQPIVSYDLTCEVPVTGSSTEQDGQEDRSASTPVALSGNTTLELGRLLVTLPANAILPGQTNCRLSAAQVGSSAAHGFTLDDVVWDVKVICDSGELTIFLAPLTICIQPPDGVSNNKLVYHSHNGGSFKAMSSDVTRPGYVCGQTRVLSLFTLGQLALPNTGFAPGRVSAVPAQPAAQAYAATTLTLSIPKLGVELDILGVPQGMNGWDVSWLGASQAGYLYGTAFPTWQGNSVLTAHVWNADNTPGPFYALKSLQHGDQFSITAYGYTYVYEVRSNQLVRPESLSPLRTSENRVVTLITCEGFDVRSDDYLYRRAVQAVLVDVH